MCHLILGPLRELIGKLCLLSHNSSSGGGGGGGGGGRVVTIKELWLPEGKSIPIPRYRMLEM